MPSRIRETFETIHGNAKQKLDLISEKNFAGVETTLSAIIQERQLVEAGKTNISRPLPAAVTTQFNQDFPNFPNLMPSLPDAPDATTPNKPTVTQNAAAPPEPEEPDIPKHKRPPDRNACSLYTPTNSGCLNVSIDAVMSISMKSTEILANYVSLGGPDDAMVQLMTSQCGDRHPSAIASDDPCLFTDGDPKVFEVDVAVSNSGTCGARQINNDNAIERYVDAGGSLDSTELNSLVVTSATGGNNGNCIGDLKKVTNHDVEVTMPKAFYMMHNAYNRGHKTGWLDDDTYYLDSPKFKDYSPGAGPNDYLTGLKFARPIEGFNAPGDASLDSHNHSNYYLRNGNVNQFFGYYYSGSPLSDSNSADGYTVEGYGTTSSPLKVNWVPMKNRRQLRVRFYTHGFDAPGPNRGQSDPYIQQFPNRTPTNPFHYFTISQQGEIIIRISPDIGPNRRIRLYTRHKTSSSPDYIGSDIFTKYIYTSATKKYHIPEYQTVSFNYSVIFNNRAVNPTFAFNARRARKPATDFNMLTFTMEHFEVVAIQNYQASIEPTYYSYIS